MMLYTCTTLGLRNTTISFSVFVFGSTPLRMATVALDGYVALGMNRGMSGMWRLRISSNESTIHRSSPDRVGRYPRSRVRGGERASGTQYWMSWRRPTRRTQLRLSVFFTSADCMGVRFCWGPNTAMKSGMLAMAGSSTSKRAVFSVRSPSCRLISVSTRWLE